KLFRSQPAVSAQIKQLEQEYGEKLLDRVGKTVRLTPAGEVLLEYARNLLNLRDESLRAVADQGSAPRGILMIGANEATCLYVLPEYFAEYNRLYPGVQISIYRNFTYKIVEKLENGAIDVGIVSLPVKSPSLKVQPIFRDQLMVMVGREHPLSRRDVLAVRDIAKEPLLFPKTGHTRRMLDKIFRPFSADLQVRMELPSIGMIKSFVAAGLGISLISASFARDEVRAGLVKLIPLEDAELWRELGLAYRRDRTLPRATTAFITTVRQLAAGSKQHAGA
ncbi:MAG TPA: LysR substrate-binding domain-containing protein, partial [Terriglobales bacterium]|nr:LysR substrate-binding domain-containing protein [Terriglobales bacterium]